MKKDRRPSPREFRALLWLLPVLAIASWLAWEVSRPGADKDPAADHGHSGGAGTTQEPTRAGDESQAVPRQAGEGTDAGIRTADEASRARDDAWDTDAAGEQEVAVTPQPPALFTFDPNTVEYHDLVRLGFTRGEALGIVKYRERGKVFEIPEDFAACYQVSEVMYRRLKPYISIGERYRLKPFSDREPGPSGSAVRSAGGGNGDPGRAVEINTADSAQLIAVSGIGPRTVVTIMEYRARLGGFVHVGQLAEAAGVTEQNYERIVGQIFVDTLAIQKIDVNFAPARRLAEHPYIGATALRKLLKTRQLKGGWSSAEELIDDKIFTEEEFARLSPYLLFRKH